MARNVTVKSRAIPPAAGVALAIGAAALGAIAVGAVAVGALAVGRLAIKKAHFATLQVDELTVRRLRIAERAA